MPLVLAIEPDQRQATILKRIVREKVHADVSVVDSPDAALGAIQIQIPDVLLLSALLSPRDEDELIAHLRALDAADHIQTHTIPQLASTAADQDDSGRGRGLFGVFRRKKDDSQQTSGCDPDLFAEEIAAYLQRAAEKKAENAAEQQSRAHQLEYLKQSSEAAASASERYAEPAPVDTGPASGSWSSPFEWKPERRDAPAPMSAPPEPETVQDPVYQPPVVEEAAAHADAEAVVGTAAEGEGRLRGDTYDPRGEIAYEAAVHTEEHATEPIPVYEEPAVAEPLVEEISMAAVDAPVDLEPDVDATPVMAAPALEDDVDHAAEPEPVAASAALRTAAALRLAPLAMWARSEAPAPASKKIADPEEPRTVSDELRSLMSALAVPPHVAGVSYARGCRIRRVRVPGGKDRRRGDTAGPVILSKRALEEARG